MSNETPDESLTAEEIADVYNRSTSVVNVVNELVAVDSADEEDFDTTNRLVNISRAVHHLENLVALDVWTTEDMTSINNAITTGNTFLSAQ